MKLTDGGIDSSCSKLGQSDLKELMKVPCGYRCHTMHRSRSGQATECHGRSLSVTWGGYATHDLGVIFHAGSDGHDYKYPKHTFLIIIIPGDRGPRLTPGDRVAIYLSAARQLSTKINPVNRVR